jgi:hypothetical protein
LAIVGDVEDQAVGLVDERHRRGRRPGVAKRVGERLLDDPVGGPIEGGRE